jgi:hypothetical protein
VSRCWAQALTGDDPAAAAAEAEQVVRTTMLDPPMYSVSQYCALVAEMLLAAERPDKAGIALDQAERLADVHGEGFTEPLRRLLRAKVVHARGEPTDVVRAAAAQAKTIATERGTYVIARRAEELIASISSSAGD